MAGNDKGEIGHVTDTAFWVATYRANEGARPDALFADPLAAKLIGERGRDIAARMPGSELVGWTVVLRTRIIDDFILAALADGYDCVLNLGAGLDTRPYRMTLPASLLWVEADFPSTIDYKTEALAGETPRCRLERRKVDLGGTVARRALFADVAARAQKVLVLTEGVVPYLTNDQVAALADDLHAQPSFQAWIAEYVPPGSTMVRRLLMRARRRRMRNAPMRFQPRDWSAFFRQHGWAAKEKRHFIAEAERHHRPPPLSRWMRLAFALMPKRAREKMRSTFGYALLVRS